MQKAEHFEEYLNNADEEDKKVKTVTINEQSTQRNVSNVENLGENLGEDAATTAFKK